MASVSTLLTSVGLSSGGLANSPWMNGRATRGSGGRPSITSSIPVSSPNRYRSGPRTISTGTPPSASTSRISPSARLRAWNSRVNASFQAHVGTLGADPVGGDGQALREDLVGVGPRQQPVLEGGGLALGGVADGEARTGPVPRTARRHFSPVGSRASPGRGAARATSPITARGQAPGGLEPASSPAAS